MRPAPRMRRDAAAGTEFQSRQDEGAAHRARSAAGAGDRVRMAATLHRSRVATRPPIPTEAVQPDAAEQRAAPPQAPTESQQQALPLWAVPSLRELPRLEQPTAREFPRPALVKQTGDVKPQEPRRVCSHRRRPAFQVQQERPAYLRHVVDDDRRHRRRARAQQRAARPRRHHGDDARALQQAPSLELASRAPTALLCGRPGRPRAVSYGCEPEHPSVEGG